MKKLSELTTPERVTCVGGLLFAIDMLWLPFHTFSDSFISFSVSGVDDPDGFLGWLSVILVLGVVAVVGLRRLSDVALPVPSIGWPTTEFAAGVLAVALMLLKFVLHLSYLGFGAWVAIVLGVAFSYGLVGIRRQAEDPGRVTRRSDAR